MLASLKHAARERSSDMAGAVQYESGFCVCSSRVVWLKR